MAANMEKLTLERDSTSDDGTFGRLLRNDTKICVTAELPWKDNANLFSCIPKGTYLVTRYKSPSKNKAVDGRVFLVNGVPNRSMIEMHIANWPSELLGCIGVGTAQGELKGRPAITGSTDAMKALLADLPNSFYLQVTGVCG